MTCKKREFPQTFTPLAKLYIQTSQMNLVAIIYLKHLFRSETKWKEKQNVKIENGLRENNRLKVVHREEHLQFQKRARCDADGDTDY